ncbi:BZIP domain-containing protein [Mycena kentingensis (nom. inval.)]|nr:BZIP domain-containing protein [Mycena kentingensis (nom. inval.)]
MAGRCGGRRRAATNPVRARWLTLLVDVKRLPVPPPQPERHGPHRAPGLSRSPRQLPRDALAAAAPAGGVPAGGVRVPAAAPANDGVPSCAERLLRAARHRCVCVPPRTSSTFDDLQALPSTTRSARASTSGAATPFPILTPTPTNRSSTWTSTSPPPLSLAGDDFDADPAPTPADTPYSAFMPTPLMDGDLGADFELAAPSNGEAPVVATASASAPPPALDFTGLLALPADEFLPEETAKELPQTYAQPQTSGKLAMYTPTTPMLDSFDDDGFGYSPTSSRGSAPVIPPPPSTHSRTTRATTRSVPGATGTRKNITPAQLIPDDAPTQKRVYLTASATSRRTVSSSSSKRRTHAAAFAEDEDGGEQLTSRELDALAAKRRQNTLAARKSRRRKLEHTQALEARVEELEREVVVWKERAGMVRAMLEARGVPVGGFEDEE